MVTVWKPPVEDSQNQVQLVEDRPIARLTNPAQDRDASAEGRSFLTQSVLLLTLLGLPAHGEMHRVTIPLFTWAPVNPIIIPYVHLHPNMSCGASKSSTRHFYILLVMCELVGYI